MSRSGLDPADMSLVRHGDRAVLVTVDAEPAPDTARRLTQIRDAAVRGTGVVEAIPALDSVLVEFDPTWASRPLDALTDILVGAAGDEVGAPAPMHISVDVDGVGPDMATVVEQLGCDIDEVWNWITARPHTVLSNGFAPGFCYLGPSRNDMTIPRRQTLQVVPAGALITAVGLLAIMPTTGPTGWWHIANTSFVNLDPDSPRGVRVGIGDAISFRRAGLASGPEPDLVSGVPAEGAEFGAPDAEPKLADGSMAPALSLLDADSGGALVVTGVQGAASLQGPPRSGFAGFGFSPGGAVDPMSWRTAQALVGGAPDGVAIELLAGRVTLAAQGRAVVVGAVGCGLAIDGIAVSGPAWLRPGSTAVATVIGGAGYVAAAGRLAVPDAFGSPSTDVRHGFGGLDGRMLRAGDRLALAERAVERFGRDEVVPMPQRRPDDVIGVCWAAQAELFSEDQRRALLETEWRVGADRSRQAIGLDGPVDLVPTGGGVVTSSATMTGDIQVPSDGRPRVLGVERQPVGGYPRLATVIWADWPHLAGMGAGNSLRFELVSHEEAATAATALTRWHETVDKQLPARPADPWVLARGPATPGWAEPTG